MKLFRRSLLLMAELSAFGWFILRDISFCVALSLVPLGIAFYWVHRLEAGKLLWLNGILGVIGVMIAAETVSVGLYEGRAFGMVILLLVSLSLGAAKLQRGEWARISGWWMCIFLIIFILMAVATALGMRLSLDFDKAVNWIDVLIFYLLVFAEPLAMGREYRASPLALGILLAPFGIAAFFALGPEAFGRVDQAYLSVWSGVSISAFHHLEGIILSFYFGAAALRSAHFISEVSARYRNKISRLEKQR